MVEPTAAKGGGSSNEVNPCLERVQVGDDLTWGQHMATNEFVDVANVILAGTLFFRPSYYEALKRLSAGRRASEGTVSREELDRVMVGEHCHAILQALCRGSVRRCDGEHCQPCNAYVIASVRSGIPSALPEIFPSCRIEQWSPIQRHLKGHVRAAVDYVESWLKTAKAGDTLPFKDVFKHLGMSSADFSNSIRRHFDFMDTIAERGVVKWGKGRYCTAFALA